MSTENSVSLGAEERGSAASQSAYEGLQSWWGLYINECGVRG
jgi:hypothetical protein